MSKDIIYDEQLFDVLSKIIADERDKANNANDTNEALDHCETIKRAVRLRSDISEKEKPDEPEKETPWLDTPMTNKQFMKDILTIGAPIIGLVGTLGAAIISSKSAEKIARRHDIARFGQLALLMHYEQDSLLDKRLIDIVNSLNK